MWIRTENDNLVYASAVYISTFGKKQFYAVKGIVAGTDDEWLITACHTRKEAVDILNDIDVAIRVGKRLYDVKEENYETIKV